MDVRYPVAVLIFIAIIGAAMVNMSSPTGSDTQTVEGNETTVETVAAGLDIPWGIAVLPGGDMLVTERPGTLLRVHRDQSPPARVSTVEGVAHRGEGGLLGIALHPDFSGTRWVYLYMTTRDGAMLSNRVVRYRFSDNALHNATTIIDGIPGALYHDGGRIAFGPDGMLYITTGDATQAGWAQDPDRLAGKILRLRPDGTVPPSNPFDNPVYSYGHRNPQGLAWMDGQLWATEHGDTRHDELNRIMNGANYGWPVIEADQSRDGMRRPAIYASGETWAPGGAAAVNDSIVFAGLRGATLYEATIRNGTVTGLDRHLKHRFGRLRTVTVGPDGALYIATSNTDGRGRPQSGDDRILRVNPAILDSP